MEWSKEFPVYYHSDVNGGVLATNVLGKNSIKDLVIFTIARFNKLHEGLMIAFHKETGEEALVINMDKIDSIKELSNMFSFNKLNDIIDIIDETRNNLVRNLNPSLVFNIMLLKIQEV